MAENATQRRLTAILSMDVKGYSKLMGDDDESTVNTITAYRRIISGLIQKNQGRVVDAPGDNILAEFGSALNAVTGAIDIQRTLDIENSKLPDHRRMVFRIGINLGDILHRDNCIYGDGVNVAARIESLAAPGGVCISRGVFDQVKRKIRQGFEYLGEHTVKNISEPVRIYRILLATEDEGKLIGEPFQPTTKSRKPFTIAVAVIFTCSAVILWMFYPKVPEIEPASKENMEYPLPDKPSIAVLPFDNMSGDPDQEYFCDGLTEEIITALSKVPKVFVIARDSVFTYKGKPVKIKEVAEDLGIRYVLEGSVRKGGDKLRITAQLIDAVSGHHLWAERYDRDLKDIFAVQDELTKKIITAMQVELTSGEQARVDARGTENLQAYLKFLQARETVNKLNIEGNALGRQLVQEAIQLDPQYAMAYRILAATYRMDVILGISKSPKESYSNCIELLNKSIELDDTYAEAYGALGFTFSLIGQHEKAVATAEKAVELDPNSANSYAMLGHTLRFADRPKEAIQAYTKAIRLNPIPPTFYQFGLGLSYSLDGQHGKGIQWCQKAVKQNPDDFFARLILTAVYSMAGRDEKAHTEAKEVLRINPKYSLAKAEKRAKGKYKDKWFEALRKAGLPENPPLPIPDKPSIAVLPFDNLSGNPDQEYFSDGITEDIITALSKTPKMLVIARNSTFTYKGKPVKIQQVANELGVRYVLEGSVQKVGERFRITAKLVDAKSGHHLWAEKYDRDLKDIFALQDEITKEIITALQVNLTEGEQATFYGRGTDNLEAYLKVMEGNWRFSQLSKKGVLKARQLAEESIALDPNYASAYQLLGRTHGVANQIGISKNPRESLQHAIQLIRRAIEIDDSLAIAHASLGGYLLYARDYDTAIAESKRALELGPSSADVVNSYAAITALAGNPEKAIPYFKEALRLNPKPPSIYFHLYGIALRDSGNYQEAIIQARKAVKQEPDNLVAWMVLTSSLGLAGQDEEARISAKEILRISPKFSVDEYEKVCPQKDRNAVKLFCDALRKAGLPE